MRFLPRPIVDLHSADAYRIRGWSSGCIETVGGTLVSVSWRPWPRRVSQVEVALAKFTKARRAHSVNSDRCLLFWHRPWFRRGVLAIDYVCSGPATSVKTFHLSVALLDEIARIQGSLIAVCHVTNSRISDRLLQRWGWEPHCPHWFGRHFIRRYYCD
jgi:hypothetical protein